MANAKRKAKAAAPKKGGQGNGANSKGGVARRVLEELVARHGAPDEAHREAFHELVDDETRRALGERTKAAGVLDDGVRFAVEIDAAYRQFPKEVEKHYARERYAYFLGELAVLDEKVEAQKARGGDVGAARGAASDVEAAARGAREAAQSALRKFAGKRAAERAALAEASGRATTTAELGDSLGRLADLAAAWIARPGASAAIQRKAAGLDEALVAATRAAAEALGGAGAGAKLAGRKRSADAPEVNVAEGSVLAEFDEANAARPVIGRLVPGPATRSVLAKSAKKGDAGAEGPTNGAPVPADAHG
jgi:hypothetical protein